MQIGEVFLGRYRLTTELKSLAFTHSYLATDQSLDRQIEVIVLAERFAGHAAFVSQFLAEARKAVELSHPAIARIYDVGTDTATGQVFVIAEHVDGTPLGRFIAESLPTRDKSVTLMESVFSALDYAHARGLTHLGLTGSSIIVSDHGRAKITGFGIATLASTAAPTADALAAVLGTSAYLAPEQILQQPLGPATDLYSAGLLLREALTHQPVFDGSLRGEALQARARIGVDAASLDATLPRNLASLLVALGALAPAARPTARGAVDVLVSVVTPATLAPTEAVLPPTEAFSPITTVEPAAAPVVAPGIDPVLASVFPANSLSTREFTANEFTAGRTRNALVSAVVISLVAVVVIAAAMLVIVRLLPGNFLPSTSRIVPELVGMTYEQAQSAVHDAGLVIDRIDVPSTTVPLDQVISSKPAAGSKLEVGATVTVDVSTGNAMIAVPELAGVALNAATLLLEQAGLKLGNVTQVPSALAPKGSIVSSLPASGTQVTAGTLINVSVANGSVRIPSLVGKSVQEATVTLSNPAIGITPIIKGDSSCPATNPISVSQQSPAPGDVPSTSKVTLTYCSGR